MLRVGQLDPHLVLAGRQPDHDDCIVVTELPPTPRQVVDGYGQAPGAAHGLDVDGGGNGTVVEPRLYQLIRQPKPIVERQFEIEFLDAGVEAFAFTFG